ncbi:MAG: hypothetical protein HYX87_06280 [Chloroflexi bacterium]|nr:hypothetical protein [Chloroflexota bacterium]
MANQGGLPEKLDLQEQKRAAQKAVAAAKDEARKKALLAQEQKISERLKARLAKEMEARAAEEPKRLADEEARKKAYAAREKKIAEDLKARADRESPKR